MTFSFSVSGSAPAYPVTPQQEAILRQAAAKVGEAAALLRAHGFTSLGAYASVPKPDGSSDSLTL